MISLAQLGKQACRSLAVTIAISILLGGCGGSGGPDPVVPTDPGPQVTTANGRLIDSSVVGVSYASGDTRGSTDGEGGFRYELWDGVPQDVSFSFGGIVIGTAPGDSILTPLDFAVAGSIDNIEVVNVSRFLQMLDSDGDPSNGIMPSSQLVADVDTMAWNQIDFSDTDFANQPALTDLLSFINSVEPQAHSLPSAQQARNHLQGSLACLSSGIYAGRFQGEDSGHFAILVQHLRAEPLQFGDDVPRPGVASALVYSEVQDRLIGVVPQQALAFDTGNTFIVGVASNGAQFSGNLEDYQQIGNGQWRNDVEGGSGTFSGARVAGDFAAVYRLAGGFGDTTPADPFDDTPDNSGGIALDVFADNTVSGAMITSRGDRLDLSGTLDGETIVASSAGGATLSITFDSNGQNPLNPLVGLYGVPGFWGSWQSGSLSGGLTGTSCSLN